MAKLELDGNKITRSLFLFFVFKAKYDEIIKIELEAEVYECLNCDL